MTELTERALFPLLFCTWIVVSALEVCCIDEVTIHFSTDMVELYEPPTQLVKEILEFGGC